MAVRLAVLKGKDPQKLFEEMEVIDAMGKEPLTKFIMHQSKMLYSKAVFRKVTFFMSTELSLNQVSNVSYKKYFMTN